MTEQVTPIVKAARDLAARLLADANEAIDRGDLSIAATYIRGSVALLEANNDYEGAKVVREGSLAAIRTLEAKSSLTKAQK